MAFEPSRRCCSLVPRLTLLSLFCLLWPGCSGGEAPPADSEKPAAQAAAPAGGGQPAADAHGADSHGADPSGKATAAAEEKSESQPPGEAPFDTTYLDVNSELFVHAKVGEILDSPLVQTLTGGNLSALERLKQDIGIDLRDVDTLTIGVVDVASVGKKSFEAMEQFNPMAAMGPAGGLGASPGMGAGTGPGAPGASAGLGMSAADPAMMSADTSTATSGSSGAAMLSMDAAAAATGGSGGSAAPAAAGAAVAPPVKERVIEVVRTKLPLKLEGLEEGDVHRVPHGETAYYRVRQPKSELEGAFFMAGPNVLVISDEATIKSIIDQGAERPRPTADLGFVKTLPHLLIAVAPRDKQTLLKDLAAPRAKAAPSSSSSSGYAGTPSDDEYADYQGDMPEAYDPDAATTGGGQSGSSAGTPQPALPELKPDRKIFEEHTQAVALLVDLSQGIRVDVALRSDSPESAGKIQAEIDRNLTQIRTQYEPFKQTLPGVIQQVVDPLVDSLAAQASEAVVSVSTQLPAEKQSMLAMVPMAVMGMMMSGSMQADNEFTAMASRRELAEKVVDEGLPATNGDELPEGLQVKGLAQWGESVYGDQAPPPLEIGVVVLGGAAEKAIAAGKVEVTEASLGADRPLKWLGSSSDAGDGQAATGFVPIVRDGLFSDHPDGGVVMSVLLAPPAEAAPSLPSLAGQLMLQIAGRTDEVLLTDVQRLRGPIEDDRLASARMNIDMSRAAQNQIDISWNESPLIGKVELVTADGVPVPTAGTSTSSAGGRRTQTISLAAPPPQDLALRVMTHGDLQEVAVPFRFENLPLPEAQELTEQQQALLVWTRGESPKDHPDLIIEAQGRWRDLEPIVQLPSNPAAARPGYPGSAGTDPSMDMQMEALDTYSGAPPDLSLEASPGLTGGRPAPAAGAARPPASDEPLRIVIDLIGPLAQSAEAVGEVEVTSVKSNIDTDLTFEGARVADTEGDPVETFIDVTGSPTGVAETPPGALRVIVNLTPPNQTIGGISQLNGNLKLRTVRERTDTILSDLQSRIGPPQGDAQVAAKPITDRELNKFGLKPVIAIEPNRVMMRLLEGKDERISGVALLDHSGLPLSNVNASVREGTGNARGRKVYAFEFPDGVPQKIGMKISVNMGVRDITIPIRLRDLPLPPPPEDAA